MESNPPKSVQPFVDGAQRVIRTRIGLIPHNELVLCPLDSVGMGE